MVQLKIFYGKGTDNDLENDVNKWLKEKGDTIKVLNVTHEQSFNGSSRLVTLIVHYEPLPKE